MSSDQLLSLIQSTAPLVWNIFESEDENTAVASYIISQIMLLYTDGGRGGINLEPLQEYIEVTNVETVGLSINNPKARVFVGKNCSFQKVSISGSNEAYIFIGRDSFMANCDIACHSKKNVLVFGFNCRIEGLFVHIYGKFGFCVTAPGVTVQSGSNFCIQENSYIIIGSDSMLSTQVFIRTSDSHGIYDLETRGRINHARPVILHPHVWISRAVTINKGAEVGAHTIVGQGSVVQGRLIEHSVYAGAPIEMVRSGVTWDRRCAENIEENHDYLNNHFLSTFKKNSEQRFFSDPYESYTFLASYSLALAGRPSNLLRNTTTGTEGERLLLVQLSALRAAFLERGLVARSRLAKSKPNNPPTKPRLAVLMMQRDEASLLVPWIQYYGNQFGLENLYVWDNGSKESSVLNTLYEYEKLGLNVDYSAQSGVDFRRKGVILGKKIQELELSGNYDFFIPVDCDEFLAMEMSPGHVSVNKDDILDHLGEFANEVAPLGISAAYNNVLWRLNEFVRVYHRKTLFRSGTFKIMDHGYHVGETKCSAEKVQTNLTYLHFHYKSYDLMLSHSLNKLRPYLDVDNAENLKNAAESNRLAAFIVEGEDAYRARFMRQDALLIDDMACRLRQIGVENSKALWAVSAD
ncbi:glycosyltransferase family 2 protein [Xanthobacter autotrophicus]|uniref:glycosyltransferase family 2 protein n=1 Tax=Xanthobacter autotrophicus TaxID=280 RepID=UPI003726CFB7